MAFTEQPFEEYNPYDPEQNELLLIEPSFKQPTMTLDRARNFENELSPKLDAIWDVIRIRNAMTMAEYITSFNFYCLHPIELKVERVNENLLAQDFTQKIFEKIPAFHEEAAQARKEKIHP